MKHVLTFLMGIILLVSQASPADPSTYKVNGQIIEKESGDGIPYATLILKTDSVNVKKMMASDVSGRFTIELSEPNSYILVVSAVGNKELTVPVVVASAVTDLGKLSMEAGVELKEVTVSAQKTLVKVEPDKIIYSMEADPEAQTNNALEMLRKVPLVTVDAEENITLNGQTNFKVLMNGKSSTMLSSNLKEVLKSLPANTIKDIEVITNPSSKYDAEGIGGIINIITTKKTISGYNGSIGGGIDSRGSFNGSAYLAMKLNKFSFSARYYGNQFRQPKSISESTGEYYNSDDFHYSTSRGTSTYKGLSSGFSGEASYEIDSLNLISLSFWGYQGGYTSDGTTESQYSSILNEITRFYSSTTTTKSSYGSLSGNIDYQKTFSKPDKSLTFSYKLDNNPSTTDYSTNIIGTTNYPSYKQHSKNDAIGREQTFQADYYDPVTKKHQVEGGLKFILRENTSTSEIFKNDTIKLDNANDLDYNQYILGAYLGYLIKWEKLSIKSGLRLERTWNDGVSKSSGVETEFTNRLFNLVPYITFSYMHKPGKTLKLSYTQRLTRPGIWYLNPYVNDIDSLNISYGNPNLESEISHSFELGYSFFTPKVNFSASTFAALVNNSIEDIIRIKPNGATETTYENIGKNQRYGINLYASYNPSPKLNIYFNGGGDYTRMETTTDYAISNEGFAYRGYLGGRWTLWKDGTVSLYSGYYSPRVSLQGQSSTFYYTGLGVSQYLLKRKLMISLSASDPFWKTKTFRNSSEDITFRTDSKFTREARTLRLSVTYNFGEMGLQVKKASRGIKNDDVKSGGGGAEGGQGQ